MAVFRRTAFSILLACVFCGLLRGQQGPVVLNEIHYDPDLKQEWVEFVELCNPGPTAVDLSGWYFSEGISFTFDAGSTLPAGGYVVVAQDPVGVLTKWTALTAKKVFGPFGGKLNSEGERLVLRDATGVVVDEVEYRLGFPWPTAGDRIPDGKKAGRAYFEGEESPGSIFPPQTPVARRGPGHFHSSTKSNPEISLKNIGPTCLFPEDVPGSAHSIQLINPQFDNDLGGSWRSASPTPGVRNAAVFVENAPPHIRQVAHSPREPRSNDVVTITAKVTDSDGVDAVLLTCQVVDPGAYIPVTLPN